MPESDIVLPDSDKMVRRGESTRIGFLLIDDFAMMSYAAVAEPFRAANVLAGSPLYGWTHVTIGGAAAIASSGAALAADARVGDPIPLDLLFVFAGGNPSAFDDPAVLGWLRQLAAKGVRIGGVSGGPYLLARAGLLDGYRCTIHWEHRAAFAEAFARVRVLPDLYVIDRDRLTCAGGTAGLDLAIALIAAVHGPALAARVGDWYIRTQARESDAGQRMSLRERYGVADEALLTALALIEAGAEEPLDRAAIARRAGVSVRQLERLFAARLGSGIGANHRAIRLARAMTMLRETGLSVTEVAIACGFVSPSHFSRLFRAHFGAPPSQVRLVHPANATS